MSTRRSTITEKSERQKVNKILQIISPLLPRRTTRESLVRMQVTAGAGEPRWQRR